MNETIKWISVKDSMPECYNDALLFGTRAQGDKIPCVWLGYYSDDGYWWDCSSNELENITHWSEMPVGPEVNP